MRVLGFILLACLVITGLQALVMVLVVTLGLAFVLGILLRPRETFIIIGYAGCWALVLAQPWLIVALLLAPVAVRWWRDQPPA
jgi:hypothetical protein